MPSPGAQRSARRTGEASFLWCPPAGSEVPSGVSHEAQGHCSHDSRTPLTLGVLGGQDGNERVEHWSHVLKYPEHLNFKLDTSLPWQVYSKCQGHRSCALGDKHTHAYTLTRCEHSRWRGRWLQKCEKQPREAAPLTRRRCPPSPSSLSVHRGSNRQSTLAQFLTRKA